MVRLISPWTGTPAAPWSARPYRPGHERLEGAEVVGGHVGVGEHDRVVGGDDEAAAGLKLRGRRPEWRLDVAHLVEPRGLREPPLEKRRGKLAVREVQLEVGQRQDG